MAELRFLILGDDFTPAALFQESIGAALSGLDATVSFRCVDTEPGQLTTVHSEEISEAYGDIAEGAALARDCHVIVTTFAPVTKSVLDGAPELLAIACGRGGPVNINIEEATRRGIPVLFAPGRNARAVAEFTVAGMINLMRQIPSAIDYVRDGRWRTPREDTFEKPSGPELGGRTVGLVGCGQVGRLVGRLLRAFGSRVLAHDPYAQASELAALGIEYASLEALLRESEVISVHARVARGAPPLLGPPQFAAMERQPYLLNTARAAAIDYEALLGALRNHTVTAALLDVYPDEPIPGDSPLLQFDKARLHLTPHSAGVSRDIPGNTAQILAQGLFDLTRRKVPAHVANEVAVSACFRRLATIVG
ncbi:MAG TPA: NAD(P)-dependent oxidoreductase [Kiloniellales bacterium]